MNLNSKKILSKPKSNSTKSIKSNTMKTKKNILLERTSGRKDKFDTDRLTKTVSRSAISFSLARDLAKSVIKKKQKQSYTVMIKQKLKTNAKKEKEPVIMTASQIKNLVESELKDRNPQDPSPAFQSQAFS